MPPARRRPSPRGRPGRRVPRAALAAAAIGALLAACTGDGDDPTHALLLQLEGMEPNAGQLLELRVVNQATGAEADRLRLDAIPGDVFRLGAGGLLEGATYRVDFYADDNGNGRYDPPPEDHAWRLAVGPVTGDEMLLFVRDDSFVDVAFP